MGTPRVLSVIRKQHGVDVVLIEVPITGADELSLEDDTLYVVDPSEQPTAEESIDASIEESTPKPKKKTARKPKKA